MYPQFQPVSQCNNYKLQSSIVFILCNQPNCHSSKKIKDNDINEYLSATVIVCTHRFARTESLFELKTLN